MPELPEAEAARCLLEAQCVGRTITAAVAIEAGGAARSGKFDDIVFDDPGATAASIKAELVGQRVVSIARRGKQLAIALGTKQQLTLLSHFGMTGSWVVFGVKAIQYKSTKVHDAEWPPRFCKLELELDKTTRLAFCDPRRLGRLRLRRGDYTAQKPWCCLAPDPITDPIPLERALEACAQKACPIKALLLDQNALVSGVGNWIADEVLYQAKVHPESTCASLSHAQVGAIYAALMKIVRFAVGRDHALLRISASFTYDGGHFFA